MLNFRALLPRIWSERSSTGKAARFLAVPALALASLPYRAAVALRNRLYDRGLLRLARLPCPVISIGNITVGGTGKTPLAIMLANLFRERGYRPAILSRGYGGAGLPLCVVSDGNRVLATAAEAGDEPLLMAQSLDGIPVVTGADRITTGTYAIGKLKANILILDDAFQHRRLFRDLDIVLIRNAEPFGNGHLLPRGPLREPASALKRADVIVLGSSADMADDAVAAPHWPPESHPPPLFRGYYRPTALLQDGKEPVQTPESLQGKKICAFAGIANPASFRETLGSLGGNIVAFLAFPDHHPYSAADIEDIRKTCTASGADITVTTEKDGMRLSHYPPFRREVFLLRVEMDIAPSRNEFAEFILKRLK